MNTTQFMLSTGLHGLIYSGHRFVWYGFRSIIFGYLIGQGMEDAAAMEYFTNFLLLSTGLQLLGGLAGSLINRDRLSTMLGAGLMALGLFLFAFTGYYALWGPLLLFFLGEGLLSTNQLAWFGKLYRQRPAQLAGGFTVLYILISIAAQVAGLLFPLLGDFNYTLAFGLGGLLLLLLTLLLLFVPAVAENSPMPMAQFPWRLGVFLVLLLFSFFYWMSFDVQTSTLYSKIGDLSIPYQYVGALQALLMVLGGAVLALILYNRRLPGIAAMAAAFLISIPAILLLFIPRGVGLIAWGVFLGHAGFAGLSELLVFAFGSTLLVKVLPPRWLAAGIGLISLISAAGARVIHQFVDIIGENNSAIFLLLSLMIAFAAALVYGLLYFFAPASAGGRVEEAEGTG